MKNKKVKLIKTLNENECPGWDVSFSEDGGSIVHCDCPKCIQLTGKETYEDFHELQP